MPCLALHTLEHGLELFERHVLQVLGLLLLDERHELLLLLLASLRGLGGFLLGELDGDGRFAFKVNDVEIYCQGTNWVPMSPYHSMDADRYKAALDLMGIERYCGESLFVKKLIASKFDFLE